MRTDRRRTWGQLGEGLAYGFLTAKGLTVRARNWRTARGELDLVCVAGDTLVFVEVKVRRSAVCGGAAEAVDGRKRHRVTRTAQAYLARHPHAGPCRLDVVSISWSQGVPSIEHLEGVDG
ncbi:MAG: YraN family protein [Candidatus Sericytochromatia bacterium]|nr:YraN family protein [Candidatus Sericytochromatia bacterium]